MVIQKPRFFRTRTGCHGGLRRGAATAALGAVLVFSVGVPASSAVVQPGQYSGTTVLDDGLLSDPLQGDGSQQGTVLGVALSLTSKPEPAGTGSPAPSASGTTTPTTTSSPTSVTPSGTVSNRAPAAQPSPPSTSPVAAVPAPAVPAGPTTAVSPKSGQAAQAPQDTSQQPTATDESTPTASAPIALNYSGSRLPASAGSEQRPKTDLGPNGEMQQSQSVSALVWWGMALVGLGILAAWLFWRMRRA